jgi:hypothetical protein
MFHRRLLAKTKNSVLFFVITDLYEKHFSISRQYKTKNGVLKPVRQHKLESVAQTPQQE